MEKFIGTKKAAEILGCTSANIRTLCADKEKRKTLGAQKVGRDWLFIEEIIDKYAEEREKKKKKKILN